VLRPSSASILGSTRAERRRNLAREKVRAVGNVARAMGLLGSGLAVGLLVLVLPWALPILYLASAFLSLAMPLRWITGHAPLSLASAGQWLLALAIAAVGIFRAAQRAEPVAPVRPEFARGLLIAAWGAALVLALADLSP
jgi:hypothetical protein